MPEAPSSELAKVARLRLQAVPQRMAALVGIAVTLHLAFNWPLVWLWVAAYSAALLAECEIGRSYAARVERGEAASGRAYAGAIALVSAVFGSLCVPLLLFEHAHDGEVYGFVLLTGGLVNLLIVSRASWTAFLASGAPYGAYLLLTPVLAWVAGVDVFRWVGVFGAGLLLSHTYAAWRRHRDTLLAEAVAQAQAEARLQEAQAAMAAKSAFVALVSHELRTPLSGVIAAGGQLKTEGEDRGTRQAAEVVVDAGRFMQALLDDLLDLAKLEAGRMSVEAVDYDLGGLIWSLERHWSAAARAAGKPLQLTSAAGLPALVSGDPTRLRQILNNLLSNALKFTGPEGVTWTVDVCAEPNCSTLGESGLTLRVTDTGPGMTPDQLARLFTAFDQTNESVARTHGGTGLGLALSRELARRMGGELSVESEPGRGSTFVLHMPLAAAARAPAAAPKPAEVARLQRALRILVVDDHPLNRRTLALLLEPSGAEITAVGTSREALERLAAEPFDVMLSDVNMPEMDGLALTRALRAGPGPNRDVPVIAVTAAHTPEEQAGCLAAGMTQCVAKPIDVGVLYAALETALGAAGDAAEARVEPKAA